jgi:hypothetical protein
MSGLYIVWSTIVNILIDIKQEWENRTLTSMDIVFVTLMLGFIIASTKLRHIIFSRLLSRVYVHFIHFKDKLWYNIQKSKLHWQLLITDIRLRSLISSRLHCDSVIRKHIDEACMKIKANRTQLLHSLSTLLINEGRNIRNVEPCSKNLHINTSEPIPDIIDKSDVSPTPIDVNLEPKNVDNISHLKINIDNNSNIDITNINTT